MIVGFKSAVNTVMGINIENNKHNYMQVTHTYT